MAISPDCNFVFLDDEYPFLAEHACIAESCVHSDPHTCIMKIGLLNEEMCRIICKKSGIEIKKTDNFAKIVHKLKKNFFTEEDAGTCIKIEKIAKSRNKAAHNLPRSEAEQWEYAKIAEYSLCAGYAVSKNFYSRFVNPSYDFPSFHMPGQVAIKKVTSGRKRGAIAATAVGAGLLLAPLPIIGALGAVALGAKVLKGIMPDSVNSFFSALDLSTIDKDMD